MVYVKATNLEHLDAVLSGTSLNWTGPGLTIRFVFLMTLYLCCELSLSIFGGLQVDPQLLFLQSQLSRNQHIIILDMRTCFIVQNVHM